MRIDHARQHRRARAVYSRSWTVLISSAALVIGGLAFAATASAQPAHPVSSAARATSATRAGITVSGTPDYRRACAVTTAPGKDACMVLIRTNVTHRTQAAIGPDQAPSGDGYGPSTLQSAYALPSSTAGSGETVAIVDAYDDPDAASDLATYRSRLGPARLRQPAASRRSTRTGQASPLPAAAGSNGWDVEESLDIDMVSAICPLCHIILVEANSADTADLGAGGQRRGQPGRRLRVQQLRRLASRPPTRPTTPSTTTTPAWRSPRRPATTATASPTRPPRSTSPRSAAPR